MKLINFPNIITCCNFLCGCLSIFFGLCGSMGYACVFILGGAFFDYFDGFTARKMGISGPIGKELDSLADVVSFGIAPSVLCMSIIDSYLPQFVWLPLIAFIMAAFSALRLAKFNCDERQTLSFIGMPTPANALFWIGLTYVNQLHIINNMWVYIVLMLVCSWLLISEIPMFSLKLKPGHNGFAENRARYIFLALAVVILIASACMGLAWFAASPALIMLLYILLSVTIYK